jgi:hypothetical protein
MDVIKKEFYHPLHIRNEQNGPAGVRGNKTVNTPVLILRT